MPSLIFMAGPIAGRRYKLGEGEYVIGRRSDCQIFVPDMRVSRQHARLWRVGESWSLEDLGSNNGTYINGIKLQSAMSLKHDDEITIANNRIRVEATEPSSDAPKYPESNVVTIVDVGSQQSLIRPRDDSSGRVQMLSSGMISVADQKAVRLIERKLDALVHLLHATASSDTGDALLEKLVDALLEVFPQADDVGVLVEDERTSELRVQARRHRRRVGTTTSPGTSSPGTSSHDDLSRSTDSSDGLGRPYGGELKVPGTIIQHVVSDRRGVLLGDASDDEGAVGTRMGAPLIYHGSHYGVVYVESAQSTFRQEDVDLLQAIATQAGLAIHATRVASQLVQRERLERDLRVARQIQRSLLPPHVPHAVGDVAGKAISAALYMARLTSELRSRAAIARTPARLLRRVNQEIAQLGEDGMFATLVYCIYDLDSRSLVFTNAGHCVPLLRRGDRVFPLQAERAHTTPLGVVAELEAGEARVQLHSGDMLIMVSDGILESRDARGNEYGLNRLSRRIRTARGTCEDVIKAILADIDSHAPEQAQGDDMTILAMSIDSRRAKRKTTTLPGVAVDLPPERAPTPQPISDEESGPRSDPDAPGTHDDDAEEVDAKVQDE